MLPKFSARNEAVLERVRGYQFPRVAVWPGRELTRRDIHSPTRPAGVYGNAVWRDGIHQHSLCHYRPPEELDCQRRTGN